MCIHSHTCMHACAHAHLLCLGFTPLLPDPPQSSRPFVLLSSKSGRFSLCSLLGVQDSRLCSMSFMKVLSQARKWPSGQSGYHPGMRAQFLIPNTHINEMRHGNLPVTLLLRGQTGNKVAIWATQRAEFGIQLRDLASINKVERNQGR